MKKKRRKGGTEQGKGAKENSPNCNKMMKKKNKKTRNNNMHTH